MRSQHSSVWEHDYVHLTPVRDDGTGQCTYNF
jgi:hypothetical protein